MIPGWNERCAALQAAPVASAAGTGWALFRLGALVWVAAMLLTPPWAYIGLSCAGLGILLARIPVHRFPGFWLGCGYAAWILASAGVARSSGVTASVGGQVWTWLIAPCMALAGQDPRIRRMAAAILCTLAPVMLLVGTIEGFYSEKLGWSWTWRMGEAFRACMPHRLNFGFTMAMAGMVLWGCGALAGLPSWWLWVGRLTASAGGLFSGARSALLGFIAGIGLLGLRFGRRGAFIAAVIAFLALVGGLAFLLAYKPARVTRILAFQDGRLPIWNQAVQVARDHPLLGVGGRKAWTAEYIRRREAAQADERTMPSAGEADAHNTWLSLAAENGLPAAILLTTFLVSLVWSRWRSDGRRAAATTLATVGCVVVASQFENYLGHTIPGVAAFAAIGATWWWTERPVEPPPA